MPCSQSTGSKDLSPIGSFGTGIGESLSFGQATLLGQGQFLGKDLAEHH